MAFAEAAAAAQRDGLEQSKKTLEYEQQRGSLSAGATKAALEQAALDEFNIARDTIDKKEDLARKGQRTTGTAAEVGASRNATEEKLATLHNELLADERKFNDQMLEIDRKYQQEYDKLLGEQFKGTRSVDTLK